MNNVKISVIMATYHGDNIELLKLAVSSILNQTLSDFELLISVDGPISGMQESYLSNLSITDHRVKIIYSKANNGPACARNVAIRESSGEYIAIMDSDDISKLDRLELQLEYIEEKKLDVCGSYIQEIDESGNNSQRIIEYPIISRNIYLLMPFICPIANPTVFARKAIFKNFCYDETKKVGEDYSLWIRLMKNEVKFGNIPISLLYYRRGNNFGKRRSGFDYFKSDLFNKLSAIYRKNIYFWPFIIAFAFISSAIRLFPSSVVLLIREQKMNLFRIFNH